MREFYLLLGGEFLKQKRSFILPLVFLTPILAGGLSFINLYVRYDYLLTLEANARLSSWNILLMQHQFLWFLFLPLVVTVLASVVYFIENKSNSWKSTLALPVAKSKVYLAKWLLVFILSSSMIVFNGVVLVLVGNLLRFPEPTDWMLVQKYSFNQLIAITSLISLQCFLSAVIRNTNISLTIGFVGVASSLFFAQSEWFSKLIPYAHTIYALPDPTIDNSIPLIYGLAISLVCLLSGVICFNKREIA